MIMNKEELIHQIRLKRSFLCVGLDTDIEKIPPHLLSLDDPIFEFNKQIIDATKQFCVAYKPNIAFYESIGDAGWKSLEKTFNYIPKDILTIADAKRGDIGNTCDMYARSMFKNMNADAITLSPYMGYDSISPFLRYENKWSIILALTSNTGSSDFQLMRDNDNKRLFEIVLEKSKVWGTDRNIMYVVGATRPDELLRIRNIVPDHFLLVPGVGAQGGDLSKIAEYGMNEICGLLINSSRGIIYASSDLDFAERAGHESEKIQLEMDALLSKKGI